MSINDCSVICKRHKKRMKEWNINCVGVIVLLLKYNSTYFSAIVHVEACQKKKKIKLNLRIGTY